MSQTSGPDARPASSGQNRILAGLVLGMLAFTVVQTSVVPILPSLAAAVHVSGSTVAWLMTANLLAAAVLTPLLGRFGDLYGHKPMLLVSLGGLALGSVLAVSTDSFALLVVARVLQGAGGGVVPLAISVVRTRFPAPRIPSGIAAISASMGIGSALGLVVTGLLMEHWSYTSVFWAGLVFSVAAIVVTVVGVPRSTRTDPVGKADPLGALTLAGWLCSFLIAVSEGNEWGWTSGRVVGLFAVAAVLGACWVVVELRVPYPLVSIRMLVNPVVAFTNLSGALFGFGMYGCFLVISNFAQTPEKFAHYGFGASVLGAGVMLLPSAVGSMVAAPVGARMIAGRGPRGPLVLGGLLSAVAMGFLAVANGHPADLYIASATFGFGLGLAYTAMPAAINSAVPAAQSGIANGMNAVFRTVGGAVGTAALGATLAGDTIEQLGLPTLGAYRQAFWITAFCCLVAAAAPLAFRVRRDARDTPREQLPHSDPAGETVS
ncbi:MFS transporter [Streptomyces sp. AM 4-1-1]|uniref:MFS transporter n=1 Tax=unclassified Streptomyces TaxID=2593676 RepID=UPI0023B920B3|nr:MFS transporter [Streptomyces sp. AM 4-1-1]WEH36345.1 MFS transporter [Streptomyces sp. AM 4-1-1]